MRNYLPAILPNQIYNTNCGMAQYSMDIRTNPRKKIANFSTPTAIFVGIHKLVGLNIKGHNSWLVTKDQKK